MRLLTLPISAILAIAMMLTAPAHTQEGEFSILVPWAAKTPSAPDSLMAFLVVQNPLSIDDRLVSFNSDIAKEHIIIPAAGTDPNSDEITINVAKYGQTVFRPGAGFLQFKSITGDFPPGSSFTATLTFERVGAKVATFNVISSQDAAVRLGISGATPSAPAATQAPPSSATPAQPTTPQEKPNQENRGGGFSRADLFFSNQ